MNHPPRRIGPIVFAIGACALLLSGCLVSGGFGGRVPEVQRRAYEQAQEPLPGDPAAAEAALEVFLQDYPDSRLADDATEELARLALLQGRRADAFARLREVIEKYPRGDRVNSVRVRLARWEWAQGRRAEARDLVEQVRTSKLSPSDRRDLARLMVKMSEGPVQQVVHLAALRQEWSRELTRKVEQNVPEEELDKLVVRVQAIDQEIDSALMSMTWEQLMEVSQDLDREIPAGRIQLILVWRELAGGQVEQARQRLSQAEDYPLSQDDEARLANLLQRLQDDTHADTQYVPSFQEALASSWPDIEGAQGTLGVVLPLSGRYGAFGREALRGILLATRIFEPRGARESHAAEGYFVGPGSAPEPGVSPDSDEEPASSGVPPESDPEPSPGVRLVLRDTKGEPELAALAVRELAADDGVVAVIGPIFSAESEAAANQAEMLQIPLLALSNRSSIPTDRNWVFRLRMTPEDEVGGLVDYAVDQMGLSSFAILYPQNGYGRGMRKRYWDAVDSRGAQVVAVAGYDPQATDFNEPIRSLVGYDLLTPNEQIALEERAAAMRRGRRLEPEQAAILREVLYSQLGPDTEPLPPLVDFDALFIPDSHEKIQLIAPQLAFHEVDGVQLLGSSEWSDPELVKIGRGHVTGAIVSTSFDLNSRFSPVRTFVADYRAHYEEDPDEFSSGGFDAASLVLTELVSGRKTRTQIRDGLLQIYGYPGVSGVTNIQPDGNAIKRPFLLEIRRGRFRELD